MSDRAPEVSVITPLYNSSPYIEGTLDSLLGQTFADWECILVDDGSTDTTRDKVEPYLRDPRFTYLRQANRGIAGARNTGIQRASGRWICLLDHDDKWLPNKLERQLDQAGAGGWDFLCSDAIVVRSSERQRYSEWWYPPRIVSGLELSQTSADVDYLSLLIEANFVSASSVMVARRFFVQLGLLDRAAAPADDYDMWLRCAPHARMHYDPEPLVEYVLHDANFSRDTVRLHAQAIYVLEKHRRSRAWDNERLREFDRSLALYYDMTLRIALRERRILAALRLLRRKRGRQLVARRVREHVRLRTRLRERLQTLRR